MTTVERLVRNLCEQKRLTLIAEKQEMLEQAGHGVAFRMLPVAVQQAFKTLVKLRPQIAKAENVIERAGYSASLEEQRFLPIEVSLRYGVKDKTKAGIQKDYERRLREVENLRSTTHIAALGKTPEEARSLLEKLQQQLNKL